MTLGMSIRTKTCQIRGKMSRSYSIGSGTSKGKNVVQVETDKDSSDYQTRTCMSRSLDENW